MPYTSQCVSWVLGCYSGLETSGTGTQEWRLIGIQDLWYLTWSFYPTSGIPNQPIPTVLLLLVVPVILAQMDNGLPLITT